MSLLEPDNRADRIARLRRRRCALERVITKALERLDRIDGDPDLEDGHDAEPASDDEPSLCGVTCGPSGQTWGPYIDLEDQCEDEDSFDREDDRSDCEPDGDGEGTPNRLWTIDGREMWEVHGCIADPDDAPDSLTGPRAEHGMGRPL